MFAVDMCCGGHALVKIGKRGATVAAAPEFAHRLIGSTSVTKIVDCSVVGLDRQAHAFFMRELAHVGGIIF